MRRSGKQPRRANRHWPPGIGRRLRPVGPWAEATSKLGCCSTCLGHPRNTFPRSGQLRVTAGTAAQLGGMPASPGADARVALLRSDRRCTSRRRVDTQTYI